MVSLEVLKKKKKASVQTSLYCIDEKREGTGKLHHERNLSGSPITGFLFQPFVKKMPLKFSVVFRVSSERSPHGPPGCELPARVLLRQRPFGGGWDGTVAGCGLGFSSAFLLPVCLHMITLGSFLAFVPFSPFQIFFFSLYSNQILRN